MSERPISLKAVSYQTPDHPLRDIVTADARGLAEVSESAMLREPKNLLEWRRALEEVKRDIEAQFAERAALAEEHRLDTLEEGAEGKRRHYEYYTRYLRWRGSARRFLTLVENRIEENTLLAERVGQVDLREALREIREIARAAMKDGQLNPKAHRAINDVIEGALNYQVLPNYFRDVDGASVIDGGRAVGE